MDIRIATNPHLTEESEQKKLIQELLDRRNAIWGVVENTAPLDKAALDLLKDRLKKDSKSIRVK